MKIKLFSMICPVYDRIPAGMRHTETWKLNHRKVIPKSQPVAYFRPDDFVPEPFGHQQGIPLYRVAQTKSYAHARNRRGPAILRLFRQQPKPPPLQPVGRRQKEYRPDVKPTGAHEKYLSRAKIREHLRGKEIYGGWGICGPIGLPSTSTTMAATRTCFWRCWKFLKNCRTFFLGFGGHFF